MIHIDDTLIQLDIIFRNILKKPLSVILQNQSIFTFIYIYMTPVKRSMLKLVVQLILMFYQQTHQYSATKFRFKMIN